MQNQSEKEKNNSIKELNERIESYQEYLHSNMCISCGEIALKLEECIKRLAEILK